MWKDDDAKIMNIIDNIEKRDKERFPVICPVCGKKEGHLYFHKNRADDVIGGMWSWCSACRHSGHAMFRLPEWWENLQQIDFEKISSFPDYLEENKRDIDEWINKLIFSDYM